MNLRPLEDRIVVRPLDAPTQTPGGIFLPDQSKVKPKRGAVLAVGPETQGIRLSDIVCYEAYSGHEVGDNEDDKVLILSQSDVLAVVEG